MAVVQVKFDKQQTNEQAIGKKSTDPGTIFFTKDKHQIIIGGEIYGGQQHKIIEHSHDIYTEVPKKPTKKPDGTASLVENPNNSDFQEYLAKLYNMDPSTEKADPINPDDYYVYKYQVVDNHAGETKHDAGSNPDGGHINTTSVAGKAAGEVTPIYARVCYVCTVAPVITYDKTTTKYACTNLGSWQQLGGEYDADKVYLSSDITMAGNYSQVGNLSKNQTGTSTFACKGMTVKEALEAILMKVEWPGTPTYDTAFRIPDASHFSYPSVPTLYVYAGNIRLTNNATNVIEVGSALHVGGSTTHDTVDGRKITYSTVAKPTSLDGSWEVTDSADIDGISVTLPNPNWGLSDKPLSEATTEPAVSRKTSGWSSTGKKFTFTWTRTGGAGSLSLTDSASGSFGSVVYDSTSHSTTWASGADAGAHTINGGTINSVGFGSTTITLSKSDADTYKRTANPTRLTTKPLPAYWIINNVGTTSDSKKTVAQAARSITDTKVDAVANNNGNSSVTCTIHAVYPFKHNGNNVVFKEGKTADWINTSTSHDETGTDLRYLNADGIGAGWTATPDTKGDGLCDVHASGSRYYYISWPAQDGKPRKIALPLKSGSTYCSYEAKYRNPDANKWAGTATFKYVSASGGWAIYEWSGTGGAQIVRIKIS